MSNKKIVFKWVLVFFAVVPTVLIPVVITLKASPFFLLPGPFIWVTLAYVYIKNYGWKREDWGMLFLVPFVLVMIALDWLVISIWFWAKG